MRHARARHRHRHSHAAHGIAGRIRTHPGAFAAPGAVIVLSRTIPTIRAVTGYRLAGAGFAHAPQYHKGLLPDFFAT